MAEMAWRKICCPVDFSEPARAGLRVATDLCRRLGAELVILHADAARKISDELVPGGTVDAKLQAWKAEAERLGVQRVRVARAGGQPEVAIVGFASENDVDLLVMGTHGRVDREHMLTGSVAEGVVRNAECPVLTVRPTWRA